MVKIDFCNSDRFHNFYGGLLEVEVALGGILVMSVAAADGDRSSYPFCGLHLGQAQHQNLAFPHQWVTDVRCSALVGRDSAPAVLRRSSRQRSRQGYHVERVVDKRFSESEQVHHHNVDFRQSALLLEHNACGGSYLQDSSADILCLWGHSNRRLVQVLANRIDKFALADDLAGQVLL